jgi:uncharacterized protein YceH (UPF0502 family)
MNSTNSIPVLDPVEQRVLGSLIEKSKTTPDYYPMTLNAITAACNQKTSRHPVTDYSEETVMQALNSLKGQSLVANAIGAGSRAMKYKHNFTTVFPLEPEELTLLCLLLLRGPQTPGELNTNSARMFEFKSLDHVHSVLNKLIDAGYARELPKRHGQKEVRYTHLLGETTEVEENVSNEAPVTKNVDDLETRLKLVEWELSGVKEMLAKITKELGI